MHAKRKRETTRCRGKYGGGERTHDARTMLDKPSLPSLIIITIMIINGARALYLLAVHIERRQQS